MPLTIAEVANPNAGQTVTELFGLKAKMVDVTFDNSYLATGELLTAAALGWDSVQGAIVVQGASNAAGTLFSPLVIKANAAQTQLTLQLERYDGASVGKAFLEEVANAVDASAFSARIIVLGT